MRKLIGFAAVLAYGAVVLAETDYQVGIGVEKVVTRRLQVQGHNAKAVISGDIEVTGDADLSGDIDLDGTITAGTASIGGITGATGGIAAQTVKATGQAAVGTLVVGSTAVVTGKVTAASFQGDVSNLTFTVDATLSVTNGGTLTLFAGKINRVTSYGQAVNYTNTVTLSDFASADVGKVTYLVNHSSSTNLIRIANGGNFKSTTIQLNPGEYMAILPVATNVLNGK